MIQFDESLQVILQYPFSGFHQTKCLAFDAVSAPDPALIVVLAEGGSQAQSDARRMAAEIERALTQVSRSGKALPAPCAPPPGQGPTECFAHRESTCRRLLIVVSDGSRPFSDPTGAIAMWTSERAGGNPRYTVIPAFPRSAQSSVGSLLPASLTTVNAFFWSSDPAEIVPAALSAVGIAPEDYRIFISYRRQDAQALADQLFDLLARMNFDVFLDQYRINPGVNFQERLLEQLAHKSMVVILESASVQASRWVQEEVAFAVAHRIGLLGIQLPAGQAFSVIPPARRIRLPASALTASRELTPSWADRVCTRIQLTHAIALARRRGQMLRAMEYSLLLRAVPTRVHIDGVVEADAPAGGDNFGIWLSPRPAELRDFQSLDTRVGSPRRVRPLVIAPAARLPGRRQAETSWLEKVSDIALYDEGEIDLVAGAIANGIL